MSSQPNHGSAAPSSGDPFAHWRKDVAFGNQRSAPSWRKRTRFNVMFDIVRDKRLNCGSARLCALIYTRMSNGRTKAQIPRLWLQKHCGWSNKDTFYEHRRKLVETGWISLTVKYGSNGVEATLYEFHERADGPGQVGPKIGHTPGPKTGTMDNSDTSYLLQEEATRYRA